MVLPLLTAVAVFAAASLLGAYALQSGALPMETMHFLSGAALALGAILAGAQCGGEGRRGLTIGCGLLLLYLIWKLAFSTDTFFSVGTLIGMMICVLCPWLSSCIFHKKRASYTNRNHTKRKKK